MRSELLTETTVRGSMRVDVTTARGSADVLATASAGATAGGLIAAESAAGAGSSAGAETALVATAAGADRVATFLAGAFATMDRDGTAGLACWTTSVECPGAADDTAGLAPGVAIVVIGRMGRTTTGADGVGIAIGGAGVVRSVVSGRAAAGLTAARTLSPRGDVANTAVKTRASSIIAVRQQRREVAL
jgi:hypothetical protein